jgi:hypothetical protein
MGRILLESVDAKTDGGQGWMIHGPCFSNLQVFMTPKGTLFRGSHVGKKAFRSVAKELKLPELTWRSFGRSVETLLHTGGYQ